MNPAQIIALTLRLDPASISGRTLLTLVAAGYAGSDFIEGALARFGFVSNPSHNNRGPS